MARKQKKTVLVKEKLNKQFTLAKVLLAITPAIAYLYVSMRAAVLSKPLQEILTSDPTIAIMFLVAMINPYIAYLLGLVQKKLKEKDYHFAVTNMIFLMIGQALTMNVFYFCVVFYLFYRMVTIYKIDSKAVIKSSTLKRSLYMGGGGLIVIGISAVCMFASLQIM